jgi:hypothetical protein
MVKTPESWHLRIVLHLQGVGEWVGLDLDEVSQEVMRLLLGREPLGAAGQAAEEDHRKQPQK